MLKPATIAAFRFGYGLAPGRPGPDGPQAVMAGLGDPGGARPASWAKRMELRISLQQALKAERDKEPGAGDRVKAARRALDAQALSDQRLLLADAVGAQNGFHARLTAFWSDHFTVQAKNRLLGLMLPDLVETAIRPHVAGRFSDMLRAAVFHPAMLDYLDQTRSVGPLSRAGRRTGRGLNENLAREVLELHSLGVGAAYTQTDVRQLAELLTGLSVNRDGFRFRPNIVEPGAETVLGKRYGGPGTDAQAAIESALQDLALHPDTAHHLARKLVVHFIGAPAPEALVARMARAYLAADSALPALYQTLLDDPASWQGPMRKVRTPVEFIVAAMRAAGVTRGDLMARTDRDIRRFLLRPLARMGQPIWRPNGPDGWPEAPEAWITPATLATRLRWAAGFAERMLGDTDPRAFLDTALADAGGPTLRFAVAGAERRAEGNALVLASPEFNRR